TNINGFRHERDSFFQWIKDQKLDQNGFYIVCGDRHWQYHSIHPTGVEEFSTGALVDANSRLGVAPGNKKGTDPEGLVKQPYTSNPASGGFLYVKVTPEKEDSKALLQFLFYDEQGKLLHQVDKTQPLKH
ncbi:MAG: alkaline phosphatase, partial [Gimesia chilikensis]